MHNTKPILMQLSQGFPPSHRNLHLEEEEEEEAAEEVVTKEEVGAEAGEHPQEPTKTSNYNHHHLQTHYHLAVQNTGYPQQLKRLGVYMPTMVVHAVTFVGFVDTPIVPVGTAVKMSKMAKNGTSTPKGVSYYLERPTPIDIGPTRGLKQPQQPL